MGEVRMALEEVRIIESGKYHEKFRVEDWFNRRSQGVQFVPPHMAPFLEVLALDLKL